MCDVWAISAMTLRFVMGRPVNNQLQRALVDEQTTHGDLVQFDFINMTLKAIGALQWIDEFCRNAK